MISFLFGFVVVMFIVYKGLQISEANQQINPPTANNAMASSIIGAHCFLILPLI